jgi:hypothetical protein
MKNFIRKIAAVSAGVIMLGTTLGAAVAADLSDLPEPIVKSGAYVNTAMVIGSNADSGARTALKTYFDGLVTSTAGEITESTDAEKIYIGGTMLDGFATSLDDSDLEGLFDGQVTFEAETYDTHEQINISGNVIVASSGTQNEELLTKDVAFYTNATNTWTYWYVFDETFSDPVSSTDELEIEFLGKKIKISSTDDSDNSVTISTGVEYALGQASSVEANGHTIHVGTIFENQVEVWVDDENHKFMSADDSESFDIGTDVITVEVDDIGYVDDIASRSVLITAGEDITTTVKDGDAVQAELGEPDVDDTADDATWVWDIAMAADDNITAADYIGVQFHQKINKYNDEPAPVLNEGYYSTPYGYITMDFKAAEPTYNEYTVTFEENYDLNSSVEADAILFNAVDGASSNEGFIYNSVDTSKVACQVNGTCWYEDDDGDLVRVNTATYPDDTTTFRIESGSNTDKYVMIYAVGDQSNRSGTVYNGTSTMTQVKIEDTETADDGELTSGYVNFSINVDTQKLGATAEDADVEDLNYVPGAGIAVRTAGTWDEGDLRTAYGTYFADPEGNANNDMIDMFVPEKEVYADVSFSLRGAGSAAEADLITATEDASGYTNLILVGGPCVNALTAEFMGKTFPACETASGIAQDKAIIQFVTKDGQTALIVAGWAQADTMRAAGKVASEEAAAIV